MREAVETLLDLAGIEVGGSQPWDIAVHHPDFYRRVLAHRNLGLGEAYMDGWWDCPRLDMFFARLLQAEVEGRLSVTLPMAFRTLFHRAVNHQTRTRAREVVHRHYDLGNDLYQAMLGPSMTYSCGYWRVARTLEEAQRDKLELICRKLMLKPGMRVLDIGCGWGTLALHAARHHGVEVVGITLSEPQRQFAEAACQGLPVTFRLQDYRDLPTDSFDRIVSVGMFEHVGHRNHPTFMKAVRTHLAGDGLALVHTIGGNRTQAGGDPWIHRYIFPNGEIPSALQIARSVEGRFVLEDWHNFGADYDRTLMAWHANFLKHWPKLEPTYGQRFFRMWTYYLLSCAGAFRARNLQLWQVVLSPQGLPGGFPIRDLREKSEEESLEFEQLDPAWEVP